MCCQGFWKSVVPFALAFTLSIFVANILQKFIYQSENLGYTPVPEKKYLSDAQGGGGGNHDGSVGISRIIILEKPSANYTDAARRNQVSGVVRLRVNFLASGQIGNVMPVSSLPHGLTEEAIAAARQIKFAPAARNGKPMSVAKIVEYNFTIY